MSTEPVPCRTLGEYIAELVIRLRASEPAAYEALRATVGSRRAVIGLDAEEVTVSFVGRVLRVVPGREEPVDGEGATDGLSVANLLGGYAEVSGVVLDGRLRVRGDLDDVLAITGAIEILLDVAARSPALQAVARDFLADPCRPPIKPRLPGPPGPATRWAPGSVDAEEAALLGRLGLLPRRPGDLRHQP